MNQKIEEKLKTLPEKPGSYQMLDSEGRIIYVGKAKNLKNRVRSYFVGAHNDKTTALVSKIDDFTYIVTKNETEAFLLEISLIKEHEPFYNIDLTDDKTYPYIEFTKEKDPKLIITRKLSKKNNRYFGPYPNVIEARKTLELLNKLYKIRRCKTLPKKPCIYYEIGECSAPCINPIKAEDYDRMYLEIKQFLNGTDRTIINLLKEEMALYSKNMDFENAKRVRDTIKAIEETITKENVILKGKESVDVYGIASDDNVVSISILLVRNGIITLQKNEVLPYYFDLEDAITTYVSNYIESNLTPDLIYVNKEYSELFSSFITNKEINVPVRGQKKELLNIANYNAQTQLQNKTKIQIDKRRKALIELGELLNIPTPYRIESFDNSNVFGDSPVSSCIVYTDGRKSPKEYRKYRVKWVEGANDYGTMIEVVTRRYLRTLNEEFKKPDLILMDGGEIQVNACKEALSSIGIDIKVAGMKKDDNHDTDTLIFEDKEYPLNKHSELYRLLFEIQEEVHRFAITFHRSVKEKNLFHSVLDEIDGIGDILKARLLKEYKTVENIKNASDEELKSLGLSDKVISVLKEKLQEEEADFE